LTTVSLALAALFPGCSRGPAAPERVIVVVVDSLRADHLGFMGYEKPLTPWIDGVAAESVAFTRAYSPSSTTVPSVPALFTGKPYSHLFQEPRGKLLIPESEVTLAETFGAHGFRNYSWSANPFVCSPGFTQGFDHAVCAAPQARVTMTLDELTALIERDYRPTGGREFHYIHTMDVHHPYDAPMPYDTMFLSEPPHPRGVDAVQYGNLVDFDGAPVWSCHPYWAQNNAVDEADIAYARELYEGTIRYTDEHLPRLLAALNYDPKRDLLIITSDHGEQFFEHDSWRHGRSLKPQETHVPLVMHFAGFPAARVDTPVSWHDLYPTFCDLFGWEAPAGLAGRSLAPALRGGALESAPVYIESEATLLAGAAYIEGDTFYYLETERWRVQPERAWPYLEGLYDLAADPAALRNLAAEAPEDAARANAALRALEPRWQPFDSDTIRERPVTFGDNLFAEPVEPETSGTGWPHTFASAEIRIPAAIAEPDAPHWLELPFTLHSGTLRLSLETEDGHTFWSYTARRAHEAEGFPLACRVRPETGTAILRIRVDDGGAVELGEPSLRRMQVPLHEPVAVGAAGDDVGGQRELSPEDQERIEALGYFR
jgi:arylsulfatase A-like enzyme